MYVCMCVYIYIYIYIYSQGQFLNIMFRMFAYRLGDLGSILGQVIPKTQKKMVLDASLFSTAL